MSSAERIPAALQHRYEEIIALTNKFCKQHLNEEYAEFCRRMVAKLCRKRPSPVITGKANTWACGIIYSLGRVNFLFDKSQTPHMRGDELCQHFDLGPSTGSAKSKAILDILDITVADPKWTLPSRLEGNLAAWLIQINGMIVDVRQMPLEIQEEAFRRGIIPYLP